MQFGQELEYDQDYPYVDEEGTEQHPMDEADYNWPPHFCQGCGFAILDCVCDHDDECPTCGDDIVDCACALERRRRSEERDWASVDKVPGKFRTPACGADSPEMSRRSRRPIMRGQS